MDLLAVADAIASTFVGASATVSGTTETLTADTATARLPNTVGQGPMLVVFPPSGPLGIGVSKLRYDTLTYTVRLLRDPLDYPTRTAWLYAWATAIRDRVETNMDLGLTYVAWAKATALEMHVVGDGEYTYGDVPYDTVVLGVEVRFNEVVTTVAP